MNEIYIYQKINNTERLRNEMIMNYIIIISHVLIIDNDH
jgi:hypothetical protein